MRFFTQCISFLGHTKTGDMMIYILIFFLKLLENAIGTIRMIVCTNGKKFIGAILQFLIGIVWVVSASLTITDMMNDPFKIFIFALGSAVGSYVGCFVEEQIALGDVVFFAITKDEKVLDILEKENLSFTVFLGSGVKQESYIIILAIPRKRKKEVISLLKNQDEKIMIISEFADITGGNHNRVY